MILVSCPLKQNDIIKIIEEYKSEEEQVFRNVVSCEDGKINWYK